MSTTTFFEITPKSWDQAIKIGKLLYQCVFRGQQDSTWNLSTTIERAAVQYEYPLDILWTLEKAIINEFRSRADHYIIPHLEENFYSELLSILQHYGGITRLLDFTNSFYIASFFASETAKQDACVWGVNTSKLFGLSITSDVNVPKNDDLFHSRFRSDFTLDSYIKDKTKVLDYVIEVNPVRKNERLAAQKGTFLSPLNIKKTFEQNLCKTFDLPFDKLTNENATEVKFEDLKTFHPSTVGVIKINLPKDWHREILLDLDSMNINSVSLFPGLDGFARSLRLFVHKMEQ